MVLVGVEMFFDAGSNAGSPVFTTPARSSGSRQTPLRLVDLTGDGSVSNDGSPVDRGHLTDVELARLEERLRMALAARFGPELMDELVAECMAWAWENQQQLSQMENPVGYLLRVSQSRSRRLLRWRRERVSYPVHLPTKGSVRVEPGLPKALACLDQETRTAVVLVHCFQWTYDEVSDLLEVPLHTVRNRIHRGLKQLRNDLGVDHG